LRKLDSKERRELTEVEKFKILKVNRSTDSQQGHVWEFENYIKERLRSLGIIQ
jgi:hypothetical protein